MSRSYLVDEEVLISLGESPIGLTLYVVDASSTAAFFVTRVASMSVVRPATVHGYTTALEVGALLLAMAVVVTGVLVGVKRSHDDAASPLVAQGESSTRVVAID